AGWLDYDLAQFGSGGLKLADIVTGEGAALPTTLPAAPGEVKTEILDLDLKNRAGRSVPVRLFHKLAYAPDGSPGASRTLVLNRARGDGTDRERAAEVRFVRFFHNTPMAIATVDRAGRIARTNAPFAKLQHGVLKGEAQPAEGRSILAVVSDADRPLLAEMIARAADGQGDIGPVDATLAGDGKRSARLYVCAVEEGDRDSEAAIIYAIETTDQRAREVLADLTMLLRRLIGENVTLEMSDGRDLWPVKTDLSQFEQVIVNLAVNARDAMPDGGKLEVRTRNIGAADCARYPYKEMPAA